MALFVVKNSKPKPSTGNRLEDVARDIEDWYNNTDRLNITERKRFYDFVQDWRRLKKLNDDNSQTSIK